ncbi:MAG: hypothetical protein M3N18_11855 [Actinomycetota bacterium]|nr:hypothetical protein [Actinomycetota bacterium]
MGLRDRIKRLEDATPGDCPSCAGVAAITVCDTREPTTEEELKAEAIEEGRCPVCGLEPILITVVWSEDL